MTKMDENFRESLRHENQSESITSPHKLPTKKGFAAAPHVMNTVLGKEILDNAIIPYVYSYTNGIQCSYPMSTPLSSAAPIKANYEP